MDTLRSASPDGDATQSQAVLPQMLSHAAFISRDTAAAVEFFTKVLGMEFVAAVRNDQIPSTGEVVPYFHSFFRMADGSTIAYFEAPDLPPIPDPPHPAYDTFRHFAMQVSTVGEVDAWHARLVAHDVEVLGPVDHGIMYSIYFHDPDGNRLEIATPTDDRWNDDAPEARTALAEWNEMKAKAKNTGTSLSSELAALSRRRHGDATEPVL
jgi:catechol 2,3-dioxygenase-like lactoylglutathione lyase family enzyme